MGTGTIINLQRSVAVPRAKIQSAVKKALKHLKLTVPGFSIVFVGAARMRRLNREFLGHDYVTDVITFAHGEIVVCPRVARANAKRFKNSIEKELVLYVVHGLLHLAGYDDKKPADIQRMRKKEQELMGLSACGKCAGAF